MISRVFAANSNGIIPLPPGHAFCMVPYGRGASFPASLVYDTRAPVTELIESARVLEAPFTHAEIRDVGAESEWLITIAEAGEKIGVGEQFHAVLVGSLTRAFGAVLTGSYSVLTSGRFNFQNLSRFRGFFVHVDSGGTNTVGATISVNVESENLGVINAGSSNDFTSPGEGSIYVYPGATNATGLNTEEVNARHIGVLSVNVLTSGNPELDGDGLIVSVWGLP